MPPPVQIGLKRPIHFYKITWQNLSIPKIRLSIFVNFQVNREIPLSESGNTWGVSEAIFLTKNLEGTSAAGKARLVTFSNLLV